MLITRKGLRALEAELTATRERRAALAKEAGEQNEAGGDSWHDNFGWDETNRDIGVAVGRINELQEAIGKAQFIDTLPRKPEVMHGSAIMLLWDGEDEPEEFVIVGQYEVDPDKGRISAESPIGQALMGKKTGDSVIVNGATIKIIAEKQWEGLES